MRLPFPFLLALPVIVRSLFLAGLRRSETEKMKDIKSLIDLKNLKVV
jgi:hypothetical protein